MGESIPLVESKDTVFIISGFMRTGTSMMMKALEAGGMDTLYDKARDVVKDKFGDKFYNPNAGGLYELARSEYQNPEFPRQFKGKLIKCLMGGMEKMKVCPKIKIILMRRDPEEIRQSYFAFFNKKLNLDNQKLISFYDEVNSGLANRRDVEYNQFWYREVLVNPRKHFQELKEAGWPILDIEACVKIVDPEMIRYKLEMLEVGIV